jgi:hypothetical protein
MGMRVAGAFAALVAAAALFLSSASAVSAQGIDCTGKPNTIPPVVAKPLLMRKSAHGALYQSNSQVEPAILVMHMYGTPYEMGFAHGTLMKQEIAKLYPELFLWIDSQVQAAIPEMPKFLADFIGKYGLEAGLDLTYYLCHNYISEKWKQEIQGIADGSGQTYMAVARVQMFPELIKAACSMFGAWGPAIKDTKGTLYQLRALDWNTNGPFQQFPTLFVYHPAQGNGHNFTSLAWAGFNGAMTGFSSAPVGVCEKVWLSYDKESSRSGIPWNFLLRDILQYDEDIDAAMNRIYNAHRTCSIWVGLGSGKTDRFRVVQYSHEEVNQFDDINYPAYPPYHPRFDGLVFVDKHKQPSHHMCLGSLLKQYYGKIAPALTARDITAVHQTGDMHIMIMDYAQSVTWVSNASPFNATTQTAIPAYDRQFTIFDMKTLFTQDIPA